MSVLYHDSNPLDIDPRIEKWYLRLHKYHFIVPLFPKDADHAGRWWYKLGFSAVWVSTVWFFLLSAYFYYLAYLSQFDSYYVVIAGSWIVIGLLFPAGFYRLIIFYLMQRKRIY